MIQLKDYFNATSLMMHLLTYVDNYALKCLQESGLTTEITLRRSVYMKYTKDHDGETLL